MKKERHEHPQDIVGLASSLNDERLSRKDLSYATWYNKSRSILKFSDFLLNATGSRTLPIGEMTPELFGQYVDSCSTISNAKAFDASLLPILNAVEYSAVHGIISHELAFSMFEIAREESESLKRNDPDPEYLQEDQIDRLTAHWRNTNPGTSEKDALDIFFFSLHADGMGMNDIMMLEWQNIDSENRVIHLKNGNDRPREIPINDFTDAILKRWKGYRRNSRFVFNLLDPKFKAANVAQMQEIKASKNKIINFCLAQSFKSARIVGKISFQMARHTFVARSLDQGMSIKEISSRLGHYSVQGTRKTYRKMIGEICGHEQDSKLSRHM